jgi:hypothetical protein
MSWIRNTGLLPHLSVKMPSLRKAAGTVACTLKVPGKIKDKDIKMDLETSFTKKF